MLVARAELLVAVERSAGANFARPSIGDWQTGTGMFPAATGAIEYSGDGGPGSDAHVSCGTAPESGRGPDDPSDRTRTLGPGRESLPVASQNFECQPE